MRIEKGVPLNGVRQPRYPWAKMEAGDCLFIPCRKEDRQNVRNNAFQSARRWVQANGPGLIAVSRTAEDGVRVWILTDEG